MVASLGLEPRSIRVARATSVYDSVSNVPELPLPASPMPRSGLLEAKEEKPLPQTFRRRSKPLALASSCVAIIAAVVVLLRLSSKHHSSIGSKFSQDWESWGQCDVIENDVAYLFTERMQHALDHIPTSDVCCKYCQMEPKCKSWTWILRSGQCYMTHLLPSKKMRKPGFVSGLSSQGTVPSFNPVQFPSQPPALALTPGSTGTATASATSSATSSSAGTATGMVTVTTGIGSGKGIASGMAMGATGVSTGMGPGMGPNMAPGMVAGAGTSTATGETTATGDDGPIKGGARSQAAFAGFLAIWRNSYKDNDGSVPELQDSSLPSAFAGISTKIVVSSGGAAGGVVTEGMGYGIMIEAFQAAAGDKNGLANGIALTRGWLGMVYGPDSVPHPFGGGTERGGATNVSSYPYGVSAIAGSGAGGSPAGVAGWKFPINQCYPACQGSATDGDEDAVLGMIYLAAALGYPEDFVDMVMRSVIAFASADLGFPDLYRTLPDGSRMYVPKGGSQWGGLLPEHGKYGSSQEAWCYNPSYFAPGHYRSFRNFALRHWKQSFDAYLPPHLDGTRTSLLDLTAAYDGAVTAGYNLLYYSSCSSGAVGNWVGVKSECPTEDALNCAGVPWTYTPYVGASGTCTASGTTFGSYGPDACRTPWRIAMDYILYTKESASVTMYDRAGLVDKTVVFNAQTYLNRMANQYIQNAQCDGAKGDCVQDGMTATFKLSVAFDQGPHMTCDNVPNAAQSWWAAFMAWPTFTSFVAPLAPLSASDSAAWLDTFASNCDFTGATPKGNICMSSYFELGQEVISTMVMAGAVIPLPTPGQQEAKVLMK